MRRGWVRVIGGALRGRRLAVPRGVEVRPTGDRVREALFGILGDDVEGSMVLDGYAGTGALGIEAISRGARQVWFVEQEPAVVEVLRKNVSCDPVVESRSRIVRDDLARAVGIMAGEGVLFDLVLLDPPYGAELDRGLRLVRQGGILAPRSLLVAEHEAKDPPRVTAGLTLADRRRYGRTGLSFYRPAPD